MSNKALPGGWINTKLVDFTEVIMGQSPPSETYNVERKGLPFYQGKTEFGEIFPTPVKYCSKPHKIAETGDILISVRAPVGPTNICPGKSCIGRGLAAIRPRSGIDSRFILYLLRSSELEISEKGTGTTFKAISKNVLSQLKFKLPPLPEQHAIVAKLEELFSDLDNGVDSLKQARAQLKTYRQAVLKYAFEGKLTAAWRTQQRPAPAADLLQQIQAERAARYQYQIEEWQQACAQAKASGAKKPPKPKKPKALPPLSAAELADLPELPEGWCWVYLAYVGILGRGKSKHRPRNAPQLFGGKYPFIQTGEIRAANRFIREFSQTYSEIGLKQSKLWPVGTLCITIAANIADTAFLGIEACFPDSVVGFTGYTEIINAKYVDYFIQSVKAKIEAFAPATAQKNINLATLENLLIPYCSFEEQHQIVQEIETRLSICEQLEQTIAASLRKAESLRQSLLKHAFEGKLTASWRTQNPDLISGEHSAAALLEKIKEEKERN